MSYDLHWNGNPYNRKQQLMKAALPSMLFDECRRNCNNENEACIANCQDKVYSAFDIFMAVKMRLEANKTTEGVIDISEFTEMDIEHGHDTASRINARYGTHSNVNEAEEKTISIKQDLPQGIREKAMQL